MSEVEVGQAADDGRASDQTRRRFLTAATSGISAVGVVGVAVPYGVMESLREGEGGWGTG